MPKPTRPAPPRLTLHAIFDSDTFEEKTLKQPCWMKDGRRLSFLDRAPGSELDAVWILDAESGAREPLFNPAHLQGPGPAEPLRVTSYTWSPDEARLLLPERAPARFSPCGNLFLLEVGAKSIRRLTDTTEPQRNAKFSPDGKSVGFVRGDNLWTLDLETGEERQWTFDAGPATYNGRFGWVYEEELGLVDGWAWSPDGRRIAYFQQDESSVPEVLLPDYDDPHMNPHRTRYPRAGDPNPTCKIGVLDIGSGNTKWMEIAPQDGDEAYAGGEFLIPRMQWTPGGDALLLQRTNRVQNRLDLLLADAFAGTAKTLMTESDPAWIEVPDEVQFVGEDRFVRLSERSGWKHIELCRLDGGEPHPVTSGEWDVEHICSVDSAKEVVTFSAARPDPTQRALFRVDLSGGEPEPIGESTPGWHDGLFNADSTRFIHTTSGVNRPARVTVRSMSGNDCAVLVDCSSPELGGYDLEDWQLLTFDTKRGDTLHARLLMPREFDANKRYPVLMHTYGGPGSQVVQDRWQGPRALWYHLLAQQGYAVFMVDNRGTAGRGAEFKKRVSRRLGQLEVEDQIAGAEYLQGLDWVNPKRIGIWGWSYGGLMAALCMTVGAEVFRAGVAVAPVSEWRLYDSIYTERYIGLPSDNPNGYLAGSPVTHASQLRGRLLLVHGLLDDNVHFQHSARLATALQDSKRHFEAMFYPGKRHGIEDRHFHLYVTITEFLRRNL